METTLDFSDVLTFHPAYETIDDFLSDVKPSTTYSTYGPWIHVHTDPQPPAPKLTHHHMNAYHDLLTACEAQCAAGKPREKAQFKKECREELIRTAIANNDVGGKWIIFPFAKRVDDVWKAIAKATWGGQLTHHAKVATTSTTHPQALYPICIYTPDFRDRTTLGRVLKKLQDMGLVKRSKEDADIKRMDAFFKPDVFTRLGMYHHAGGGKGNRGSLRMDPILYRIDDFAI